MTIPPATPETVLEDYDKIWEHFLEQTDIKRLLDDRTKDRTRFHETLFEFAKGKKAPKVLEVGCGTGLDINILYHSYPSALCFGSDLSRHGISISLRLATALGSQINFFISDTRHLPLRKESLDLVFSQGLLEHFTDPLNIATEQSQALRRGGILVINVPQRYSGYTLQKKWLIRNGKWELGWEREFSYADLRKLGKRLGLVEKSVFGYQYFRSWWDFAFVLRDLYEKFDRRNPLRNYPPFPFLKKLYDSSWDRLEQRWGHYFMQNIVIVFQKPLK
jgi:SAM-dependent methyltransferase